MSIDGGRYAADRDNRIKVVINPRDPNAIDGRELPLSILVLMDPGGEQAKDFAERKPTKIDNDNFDEVMKKMNIVLPLEVEDKIKNDGGKIPIELRIEKREDWEPQIIARQVEPLRNLLAARDELVELQRLFKKSPNKAAKRKIEARLKELIDARK